MKKFLNLMLAAMVIMGAAACTENFDDTTANIEKQGLSFEATIDLGETRTDVVFNEDTKKWDTVWSGDETLVVQSQDDHTKCYNFTNSVDEKNRFTCNEAGAEELLGKAVCIWNRHANNSEYNVDSKAGKSGGGLFAEVDSFDTKSGVNLVAQTSFLRYSSEFEVTFNSTEAIFLYDNNKPATTITLPKGDDVWVAVLQTVGDNNTLSYSVNGIKCKETKLNIAANKIYNLGELTAAEITTYSIAGTNNSWTIGQTPMYKAGKYVAAYGVKFGETSEGDGVRFKIVNTVDGNDTWIGAHSTPAIGYWKRTGSNDIKIMDGTYDIYYSPKDNKYLVIEAGASVPAMPEFCVGVIGISGDWDNDKMMTLNGEYYTLKSIAIAATDEFKIRISRDWDESYGVAGNDNPATISIDAKHTLADGGNNMKVAAGTYDLYFNYNMKEFYVLTVGTTPEELSIPQYKIYVYTHNNTWDPFNIYSWNNNNSMQYAGEWPGTAITSTTKVNNYTYKVFTMPKSATGQSVMLIFNGEGSQTANCGPYTLDSDLYLLVNGVSVSVIKDKNNPEQGLVPTPGSNERVIYLNAGVWDQANAYFEAWAWGGSMSDAWYSFSPLSDGRYFTIIPKDRTGMKVLRKGPGHTSQSWEKWDESGDLTIPADKSTLVVEDWSTLSWE